MNPGLVLRTSLSVDYPNRVGVLRDLRLEIGAGKILGLVGTSGGGKSTLALALMGLLDVRQARCTGSIEFSGRELLRIGEGKLRAMRGREMSLVLQSPLSSLNPVLRIGTQLREAWFAHRARGSDWRANVLAALREVSLPVEDEFLLRRSAQISIGQAQRVLIAMAILHRPQLLIADEATSALDAITQAEVLELFSSLNKKLGMTILFISHDLLSVSSLCDEIAILHEGRIIEQAVPEEIFAAPQERFTRELLQALPARLILPKRRP